MALINFQAKLKLFQKRYPSSYYQPLIEKLLKITTFQAQMNLQDIEKTLEAIDDLQMPYLMEHLKQMSPKEKLTSPIEKKLYQTNQEKLRTRPPEELERERALADFSLISNKKIADKKHLSYEIKKIRRADELEENIQQIPIISQTMTGIKHQDLISKALIFLHQRKNEGKLPSQGKDLIGKLENPAISQEAKISAIQHSLIFSSEADFYARLAQNIKDLKTILEDAALNEKDSDKKQALTLLNTFFSSAILEKRIFDLPTFLKQNQSTLACLKPQTNTDNSIWTLIKNIIFSCFFWMDKETPVELIQTKLDELNQSLEGQNEAKLKP